MADNNEAMAFIYKQGGPAFPAEYAMPEGGHLTMPGQMLRDYFAAHCPLTVSEAWSIWSAPHKMDDLMKDARERGGFWSWYSSHAL